jgi:pSer/pThr/pTyr-binding forkhead associated (FHA) protein
MDFALFVCTAVHYNLNAPRAPIFTKPNIRIGCSADVCMDTSKTHEVLKQHAQISFSERHGIKARLLENFRSLNGTFVNEYKVHKRMFTFGDEVVFGAGSCFMYGDVLLSTDNPE